jgi:putative transposase
LILSVHVSSASVQDRDGAKALLEPLKDGLPRFAHLWADGSYAGELIEWVKKTLGWTLEVVKKPEDQKGFVVLPRRWVVERTLAWLGKYRRLSKDYEVSTSSSEALIYIAMTHRMLRRLRPARAP